MSNHLQTYCIAVHAYEEAVYNARRVSEVVNRGATALRNWEQVQVTDIAGAFPDEFTRSARSENHLKGEEWPAAQQIADVLLAYHKTKLELEAAFLAIPDDQRHAVKTPESVTPPR
ncbi:MAG: hypothetical protein ACT4QC_15595 [Planctomycetaceae bacterium]